MKPCSDQLTDFNLVVFRSPVSKHRPILLQIEFFYLVHQIQQPTPKLWILNFNQSYCFWQINPKLKRHHFKKFSKTRIRSFESGCWIRFITCSWHVFTNSESTIFFHEMFLTFFKKPRGAEFFYWDKRHFSALLKETKKYFAKKNRRFGIRENMSRWGYIIGITY